MSGYSYGLTAHQQALELLAALSNPEGVAAAIQASKDATAEAEKALANLKAAKDDASEKLAQAQSYHDATAKMMAEVSDHKAEIARRQDSWEANLNARETDLKRREDEHASWWARQQDEASIKASELVNRSVTLDAREKSLKESQSAMEAMKSDLQAKLAKIKAINE